MRPDPHPKVRWPWGEWSEESPRRHANAVESGRAQTMAVGSFPDGASPYGCMDMCGNVWEWTISLCKDYPYRNDERNSVESTVFRTLRGGSWSDFRRDRRVSNRLYYFSVPGYYFGDVGFRVVVAPVFE